MMLQMRLGKKLLLLSLVAVTLPLLLLYVMSAARTGPPTPVVDKPGRSAVFTDLLADNRLGTSNLSAKVIHEEVAPPSTHSYQGALADHVWKTCKERKMATRAKLDNLRLYSHILVEDRYKLLYCYVPKVACTNWRRVLLVMAGQVRGSQALQVPASEVHGKYKRVLRSLSDFSPAEAQYRLDHYYKFMFVREPFERLLSAWRNKFQSNLTTALYFHRKFGRYIVQRFRQSTTAAAARKEGEEEQEEDDDEEEEFQLVPAQRLRPGGGLAGRREDGDFPSWGSRKRRENGEGRRGADAGPRPGGEARGSEQVEEGEKVRLEEFLRYLVDPERREPLNEHWQEFQHLCHPCALRYDFVGRYESLEEDAGSVLRAVGAQDLLAFPRRGATYKHNSTASVVSEAYGEVPPELLRRVYEAYRVDFDLFDYRVPRQLWDRINGNETMF